MTVIVDLIFTVSVIIALICLMIRIEIQSREIIELREEINEIRLTPRINQKHDQ